MTFQLLFYFIFLFNPNRVIEGFWDVTVSDETITQSNDKEKTGDKNDKLTINSEIKPAYDALKVTFDEHISRSLVKDDLRDFLKVRKLLKPEDKPEEFPEDYPRPIDPAGNRPVQRGR